MFEEGTKCSITRQVPRLGHHSVSEACTLHDSAYTVYILHSVHSVHISKKVRTEFNLHLCHIYRTAGHTLIAKAWTSVYTCVHSRQMCISAQWANFGVHKVYTGACTVGTLWFAERTVCLQDKEGEQLHFCRRRCCCQRRSAQCRVHNMHMCTTFQLLWPQASPCLQSLNRADLNGCLSLVTLSTYFNPMRAAWSEWMPSVEECQPTRLNVPTDCDLWYPCQKFFKTHI